MKTPEDVSSYSQSPYRLSIVYDRLEDSSHEVNKTFERKANAMKQTSMQLESLCPDGILCVFIFVIIFYLKTKVHNLFQYQHINQL